MADWTIKGPVRAAAGLCACSGAARLGRLALACALALCCLGGGVSALLASPQQALGMVNFGTVGVSCPRSLSLTPGQSTSVACTVNPSVDYQTANCETDYCPSGCELSTGSGCQDANGNCICFSSTYSPYYATVNVTSSNPSVARASYANGALSVAGYAPGTCTITVYGQLRMWTTGMATMQVNVAGGGSSLGSGSSSSGVSGNTSAAGVSGSGGGGTVVSVTTVGGANMAAAAAAVAQGASDDVVELTTDDGSALIVVEAGDRELAARELAKIADTDGTCTFWSGGTIDAPLATCTFNGQTLDAAADLHIDTSVTVTQKGSGVVATMLEDVADSVVLDFAHSGKLPGPAEVCVSVGSVYDDGQALGLHCFDEGTGMFDLVQGGVTVADGTAQFTIDHCSTWALSTTDLRTLEPIELAPGVAPMWIWIVGGVAAAVVVALVVLAVVRRKRA